MIYAHDPTDWAGLGQFLLGLAAILALLLQRFQTNKKIQAVHDDVKKTEKAVNGRPDGVSTMSDDIAEVRAVALDAKDSVAALVAGLPDLQRHLRGNMIKMDDLLGTVHDINKKQEELGSKVHDHLAAHQADSDHRVAWEKKDDEWHRVDDERHARTELELETGEGG